MAESGFKKEYSASYAGDFSPGYAADMNKDYGASLLNGATRAMDGSATANAALMKATLALDRMERHEAECGRRWGIVMKLMLLVLTKLGGLLAFLITDKLGWFL